MATTTPNYGWAVPTSTDLVKDGATAIETLGDAIDASMNTALGTKKAMGVLLSTVSFNGVSAHNATNVLSSTYSFYRVEVSWIGSTSSFVNMRFRENTTDKATAYFGTKVIGSYLGGTVVVDGNINNGTNMLLVDHGTSTQSYVAFDLALSNSSAMATIIGNGWDEPNGRAVIFSYKNSAMTTCTGFSLIPNSGTITGKISIYAYN